MDASFLLAGEISPESATGAVRIAPRADAEIETAGTDTAGGGFPALFAHELMRQDVTATLAPGAARATAETTSGRNDVEPDTSPAIGVTPSGAGRGVASADPGLPRPPGMQPAASAAATLVDQGGAHGAPLGAPADDSAARAPALTSPSPVHAAARSEPKTVGGGADALFARAEGAVSGMISAYAARAGDPAREGTGTVPVRPPAVPVIAHALASGDATMATPGPAAPAPAAHAAAGIAAPVPALSPQLEQESARAPAALHSFADSGGDHSDSEPHARRDLYRAVESPHTRSPAPEVPPGKAVAAAPEGSDVPPRVPAQPETRPPTTAPSAFIASEPPSPATQEEAIIPLSTVPLAEPALIEATSRPAAASPADTLDPASASSPASALSGTASTTGIRAAGDAHPVRLETPFGSPSWSGAFAARVTVLSGGGVEVAQLHLNPPELGPVAVTLHLAQEEASARFVSPHAVVREAIEAALPRLREMLAESGITLGEAHVSAQSSGEQAPPRQGGRPTGFADAGGIVATDAAGARPLAGLIDTYA
jgi:flagellar hook-length control protein FliK